ncbi:concanavalin A-like lectin/glucanase domain-containing protein [Syncephalis plumigaleata]|nr:concanavalin A-like lectin/glucanase domain-containing protein [Syncephalis plumigaleata]
MHSQVGIIVPAVLLFLASALITTADAKCGEGGNKCDKFSPCCSGGYCDSKLKFCAVDCNSEGSYSAKSCFPRPGCKSYSTQFGDAKKLTPLDDYDGNYQKYELYSDFKPNYALINSNGELQLDLKYRGDQKNEAGNYGGFGATVTWTRFMLYGKATVEMKSASVSPGVVSSFITKSPEGDEIDFEWVGKDPKEVQTNFYYRGELDYTKGAHHKVTDGDTSKEYHKYTIEWTPEYVAWGVDGKEIRRLAKTAANKKEDGSFKYPDSLSRVQLSIWDGGMGLKGTADWAGTPTDWSDKNKVYSMYVKSLTIECANSVSNETSWPPAGYGPEKIDDGKSGKKGGKSGSGSDAGSDSASAITVSNTIYTCGFALAAVVISVIAF